MKRHTLGAWLAILVIPFVLIGCGSEEPAKATESDRAEAAGSYAVVATIGMVADIVERVAGERATVEGLIGASIDPHLYKPTRSDVQRLLDSDVIFYNGLLLEGKMTDTLVRAATSGKKVFAVTELIDEAYLIEPEGLEGLADPHVWMDPAAWIKAVEVVRDRLQEYDPEGADAYAANAANLIGDIEALDAYAVEVLGRVPAAQRVLVTAHDAFNYFGKRFGFEVLGIQGISTESEVGLYDLEQLVDTIVEREIPAVFVESTVSERSVRALVSGAAARGHEVRIGGTLFSDAMGPAGTYEGTYVGMIDHNVNVIASALGVDVPSRGMSGKLSADVGGTP